MRVLAGARLATVPERRDPNSTHQTLGNGFEAFSVALDRAFVHWKPTERVPLTVFAGKFGHAFMEAPILGRPTVRRRPPKAASAYPPPPTVFAPCGSDHSATRPPAAAAGGSRAPRRG